MTAALIVNVAYLLSAVISGATAAWVVYQMVDMHREEQERQKRREAQKRSQRRTR